MNCSSIPDGTPTSPRPNAHCSPRPCSQSLPTCADGAATSRLSNPSSGSSSSRVRLIMHTSVVSATETVSIYCSLLHGVLDPPLRALGAQAGPPAHLERAPLALPPARRRPQRLRARHLHRLLRSRPRPPGLREVLSFSCTTKTKNAWTCMSRSEEQ